jgi:putative chitinase
MARMLEQGSKGSDVAELQRELNASLGGPKLVVDGDFGPRTRAAVEAFQREHHLTVDGIVGPETRAALAHHAPKKKPTHHEPPHHQRPAHHGGGTTAPSHKTYVTLSQLHEVMPGLTQSHGHLYIEPLNAALGEFHIDTHLRIAAFLGQIAEESVELNYFEEIASGWEYDISRNRSLALELGNTHYGDGPRYKGRGPIQLTGRSNYIRAGEALHVDLVDHPSRAASPDIGFRTAGWYWVTHGLNSLADERDYRDITLRINGGLNGYSSRIYYYDRALKYVA